MASRTLPVKEPFHIDPKARIWAYREPVSMACGFPRLLRIITEEMEHDISGSAEQDLFVFVNKKQTYLKILYRGSTGFCLWAKKLDKKHRFPDMPGKLTLPVLTSYVNALQG